MPSALRFADRAGHNSLIRPSSGFFKNVEQITDPAIYAKAWQSFLKIFLYRALRLRRMLEQPQADAAERDSSVIFEIKQIDRMLLGARAFHSTSARDSMSETWEYKFATIQHEQLNNAIVPATMLGGLLEKKYSLSHMNLSAVHQAALNFLERLSDPFMHLRNLDSSSVGALSIHFDIASDAVDLNEVSASPVGLEDAEIKQDALRFYAVRAAIDYIVDQAVRQSRVAQGKDFPCLFMEWDPAGREIRIADTNPVVHALAAFEEEETRRKLIAHRQLIHDNARIQILHTLSPEGMQRIAEIFIRVPESGTENPGFEPTAEETARLNRAFELTSPIVWHSMNDDQRADAIYAAAQDSADAGMDPMDLSPEALGDYIASALPCSANLGGMIYR